MIKSLEEVDLEVPSLSPAQLSKKTVNPNTRAGVKIHPWDKIRKEYVEGYGSGSSRHFETGKEIAARYGIGYFVLRNRASKEKWKPQREAYLLEQATKRRKKRAAELADKAVEFDLDLFDQATTLLKIIESRFEEIVREIPIRKVMREEEMEKLVNGQKINRERMYTAVRADELERLANALMRAKEIEAKAVGEADQILQLSGTVEHVSVGDQLGQPDNDRLALILKTLYEARALEVREGKIVLFDRAMKSTQGEITSGPTPEDQQQSQDHEVVEGEVVQDN